MEQKRASIQPVRRSACVLPISSACSIYPPDLPFGRPFNCKLKPPPEPPLQIAKARVDAELLAAVVNFDIARARTALGNGADVKITFHGSPLLMMALPSVLSHHDFKNTEMIRFLIGAGADVNARGDEGRTVLMAAARWSPIESVNVLIGVRADVNARDNDGKTALMIAEAYGRTAIASRLRGAGARK